MTMNRLIRHRARRIVALTTCLALFVVGSNYCLLSAWGGNVEMACLRVPGVVAKPASAGCHHCPPARDSRAGSEDARPSCCPAPAVAPSAPAMDRDGAGLLDASSLFVAVVVTPSPQLASAWHGHRVLPDGQPPTRLAAAPLPARAPPLA